mmetsp:Transcript_2215/g.5242  ORF Transcript_2215/g.5242 Transcript_2215/m.5242 type:complete len:150 (-) Transcript_2215:1700-2149(-)
MPEAFGLPAPQFASLPVRPTAPLVGAAGAELPPVAEGAATVVIKLDAGKVAAAGRPMEVVASVAGTLGVAAAEFVAEIVWMALGRHGAEACTTVTGGAAPLADQAACWAPATTAWTLRTGTERPGVEADCEPVERPKVLERWLWASANS